MPTLRETTALILLYRACHDENLRAKVRGWLPEVAELAGDPNPSRFAGPNDPTLMSSVCSRRLYGGPNPVSVRLRAERLP